jgi:sec-independent protein translocase protein TatA
MYLPILAFLPSGGQWLIIAMFGLLLFGKRLPEVGRSLGKGIVEFKKGLKGVEEEIEQVDEDKAHSPLPGPQAYAAQQSFKFDPYTGKPVDNRVAADESQKAS